MVQLLDSLSADILLQIALLCEVEDLHNLEQTCRYLKDIFNTRRLWLNQVKELPRHLAPNLPQYCDIDDVSTAELRRAAIRAYKAHINWITNSVTEDGPVPSRVVEIEYLHEPPPLGLFREYRKLIILLPGACHAIIDQKTFFQCVDLRGPRPRTMVTLPDFKPDYQDLAWADYVRHEINEDCRSTSGKRTHDIIVAIWEEIPPICSLNIWLVDIELQKACLSFSVKIDVEDTLFSRHVYKISDSMLLLSIKCQLFLLDIHLRKIVELDSDYENIYTKGDIYDIGDGYSLIFQVTGRKPDIAASALIVDFNHPFVANVFSQVETSQTLTLSLQSLAVALKDITLQSLPLLEDGFALPFNDRSVFLFSTGVYDRNLGRSDRLKQWSNRYPKTQPIEVCCFFKDYSRSLLYWEELWVKFDHRDIETDELSDPGHCRARPRLVRKSCKETRPCSSRLCCIEFLMRNGRFVLASREETMIGSFSTVYEDSLLIASQFENQVRPAYIMYDLTLCKWKGNLESVLPRFRTADRYSGTIAFYRQHDSEECWAKEIEKIVVLYYD